MIPAGTPFVLETYPDSGPVEARLTFSRHPQPQHEVCPHADIWRTPVRGWSRDAIETHMAGVREA
jgi:hypothetical protein